MLEARETPLADSGLDRKIPSTFGRSFTTRINLTRHAGQPQPQMAAWVLLLFPRPTFYDFNVVAFSHICDIAL
jgi:hypothetical protein